MVWKRRGKEKDPIEVIRERILRLKEQKKKIEQELETLQQKLKELLSLFENTSE